MAFRSAEGPMEFAWENGSGPVDEKSPWMSAISRNQSSLHSQATQNQPKRSRSEFESPTKSISSTSDIPTLRPAANQTILLPQPRTTSPEKPLPPPPSRTVNIHAFRTPSKHPFYDFTSGDDTPEENHLKRGIGGFLAGETTDADSEATPEQFAERYSRGREMGGSPSKSQPAEKRRASPKKRQSFLGKTIQSLTRKRDVAYSHKAESRVTKRRRAERGRVKSLKHGAYDSDSENDAGNASNQNVVAKGAVASFLGVIESHPNAPRILINYLQLLSNFLFILFLVYIVYSFWTGVIADVDHGVNEKASEAILRFKSCKDDWVAFRCADRPERTRATCEEIATCLANDPEKIPRAQVSANTFGKILNDFAEPISFKAMFFYFTTIAAVWMASNLTWNSLRNKFSPEHMQHAFHHPPPPATPSRHASGNALPYGTPYHPQLGYYSHSFPGPAGSFHGMLPLESSSQPSDATAGATQDKNMLNFS